jgi:sterol desaturase/sphingolipid hydroxylase (fatty acid hydroxylase superfamily)
MSLAISERATLPWAIQWGTWPVLFTTNLLVITHAVTFGWDLGFTLGALIVTFAVILVALEFAFPLDERWRMTWKTFLGRDIKYFLAGGLTGAAVNAAIGILGLSLAAGHQGPMTDWPLWLAVPSAIIGFDVFQYWQHRWSHEADTPLKRFLWKTHVQHHLPEQVYVLMHPAGHPINFILLQGLIRVPLFYALGLTPEAVFAVSAITGLQGLVSHCNVDLRAGWANYVFIGTELHRYHHSGKVEEAGNFAVTLSLLDILFGTFVYRPGVNPDHLGVAEPEKYPLSSEFWRAMAQPFK